MESGAPDSVLEHICPAHAMSASSCILAAMLCCAVEACKCSDVECVVESMLSRACIRHLSILCAPLAQSQAVLLHIDMSQACFPSSCSHGLRFDRMHLQGKLLQCPTAQTAPPAWTQPHVRCVMQANPLLAWGASQKLFEAIAHQIQRGSGNKEVSPEQTAADYGLKVLLAHDRELPSSDASYVHIARV